MPEATEKRVEAALWCIDRLGAKAFREVARTTGFPETKKAARAVLMGGQLPPHAGLFLKGLEKQMALQILGVEDVAQLIARRISRRGDFLWAGRS